jgi:tRNA-specific 2-thiouridylase
MGVKFTDLLGLARDLGADCLATGHYVRRVLGRGAGTAPRDRSCARPELFPVRHHHRPARLSALPARRVEKTEVRALAAELGLGVAGKPDSQDICFVPDGDYAGLVSKLRPEADAPGRYRRSFRAG